MTNTNPDTGIRYGTIYANSLNQDLLYTLMYEAGKDMTYEQACKEHYDETLRRAKRDTDDFDQEEFDEDYECPDLDIDEPCYTGCYEGVEYATSFLGGAILVWIFKSPHTNKFRLCSPCVPNAGDLNSPDENGYEAYDVPADWRAE